jgi:glycosyltransferase involved in cell wall biosynthesis
LVVDSLKANKVDVILVEFGTHAHKLISLLRLAKLPVVVHFHGFDASAEEALKSTGHYKEVFSVATKVIAVSKDMQEQLIGMGCEPEKLCYTPCGPGDLFFEVEPRPEGKLLFAAGRFTDKKAPYYTLLAFDKVLKTIPEAKLIMAGNGPLLNTCINLAKFLNIDKNVHFPGVLEPQSMIAHMSKSTAFVQHSVRALNGDSEGTPVTITEASAAGLPVVATRHAGIKDVIKEGETGLLCDEHDVEQMASNMERLLTDPELAEAMGRAGRKRIADHFSMDHHIDAVQRTLNEAVDVFVSSPKPN